MAIQTDLAKPCDGDVRLGAAAGLLVTRIFAFLLGLGAVVWGCSELPLFWRQGSLNRVASEILQGHSFAPQLLVEEAREAQAAERRSHCNPAIVRDVVAVRLAVFEASVKSDDKTARAAAFGPLDQATRTALACTPGDAFDWLTLFWLDLIKHGFTPENAAFLRLSYTFGPNEAWIAIRRSRLTIPLFARLPADLRDDAVDEFVKLVDTEGVFPEMAAIFATAAPAVQGRLAAALESAKPIPRQIFARALSDRGVKIDIPGVAHRPWE